MSSAVCERSLTVINTVKIQDVRTSTHRQLDLLVMENLFYKQDNTQIYDLKGIGAHFSLETPIAALKMG